MPPRWLLRWYFAEQYLEPDMPNLGREARRRLEALTAHPDLDVRAMALASLRYAAGHTTAVCAEC